MNNLLKQLVEIQAVSGEEKFIFSFLEKFLTEQGIKFEKLSHGDIYVGQKNPELLFTAHVDEVGFQIDGLNKDGTGNFKGIGWVYPWLFPGRDVQVQTEQGQIIYGVVIYDKSFDNNIKTWKKLKIDFGFNSKEDAEKVGVKKGIFGTYKKEYRETEDRIFATAIDNRLGVWKILNLLLTGKEDFVNRFGIAFTSDEEMENAGAKKTIPHINPEYLCIVDVMPHSLMDNPKKNKLSDGPYLLDKTLDYKMPDAWKKILKGVEYRSLSGKSKYLINSEPKMFQKKGFENSINFLTLVGNYHHGTYSVSKQAIDKSVKAMEYILDYFKKQ